MATAVLLLFISPKLIVLYGNINFQERIFAQAMIFAICSCVELCPVACFPQGISEGGKGKGKATPRKNGGALSFALEEMKGMNLVQTFQTHRMEKSISPALDTSSTSLF